jgi:hypothetical protein
MAISDEMREQLEMVVQYGDQVKAMFKEQDDVDYEIGDYDEPITQMLGHMNEKYLGNIYQRRYSQVSRCGH